MTKLIELKGGDSSGTQRYRQKSARRYGVSLDAYAQKLEDLNKEYGKALPKAERSVQYVVSFQTPQTEEEFEAVKQLLGTLEFAEENVLAFRDSTLAISEQIKQLPNLERRMNRANRKVVEQYGLLVCQLDKTLEMIQQVRALTSSNLPLSKTSL